MEDDLVEIRVSTTCQESVEFDEEEEVGILALRGCSVPLLDVVAGNVDTLSGIMWGVLRTASATSP